MDKAIFRESDHSYWLGEKQLISVTQLLKKHGLSTNYSMVNSETLNAKAERGTLIHKEIEDYIKNGDVGFTSELSDFIDIVKELRLSYIESEVVVNNDIVAGTLDIMAHRYLPLTIKTIIADNKTCATLDKRAVRWQLSLYERLSGETFDEFYAFRLGEKSKPVLIDRMPAEEIDRLLECERNGEIYQEPGLVIAADLLELSQQAEQLLKQAEAAKDAAEATAKEYRQMLYEAMGSQNISSWETLDKSMLITRVSPSTKNTIYSVKLKKDLPDIAAKYSKTSDVKGYVKITLREV